MKAPKNFDKIHLKHFTAPSGSEYKIGIEETYEDNHIVWAFKQPDNTMYCLALVFNWKLETYEVKRAENGRGTIWDKTLHEGGINKNSIKSMHDFIDWFSKVITVFEYDYK